MQLYSTPATKTFIGGDGAFSNDSNIEFFLGDYRMTQPTTCTNGQVEQWEKAIIHRRDKMMTSGGKRLNSNTEIGHVTRVFKETLLDSGGGDAATTRIHYMVTLECPYRTSSFVGSRQYTAEDAADMNASEHLKLDSYGLTIQFDSLVKAEETMHQWIVMTALQADTDRETYTAWGQLQAQRVKAKEILTGRSAS